MQGLVGFRNLRFSEIKSCPSASPTLSSAKWRFHAKNDFLCTFYVANMPTRTYQKWYEFIYKFNYKKTDKLVRTLRAQGWQIYNFNNISLYWIYHANNWGKNIIWIVDISPIWVNISHIYPSFTYISVPQTEILPIYCPQVSFWSLYTKYFAKIYHLWGVPFPQKKSIYHLYIRTPN